MRASLIIKTCVIFCFTAISFSLFAQQPHIQNLPKYDYKKYHFGFILGFNNMDFVIKPIDDLNSIDTIFGVESSGEAGFNIGIVSNLRIAKHFDLRFVPTLSFGDRNILFSVKRFNKQIQDTVFITLNKLVESTYIDFPFYIKYKSKRLVNTRAYVLAGVKYSLDLASQAKKEQRRDEYLIKLKKDDILLEVGVGFDFYLTYFKFGIELKMSYGFLELLKREENMYAKSIDHLRSKIFQISFTFE